MPEGNEYEPPEEQHQDQQDHPARYTLEIALELLTRRILHDRPTLSLTALPLVKPRQSLFQVIENHDLAGGFFMHFPEDFIHPGKTE